MSLTKDMLDDHQDGDPERDRDLAFPEWEPSEAELEEMAAQDEEYRRQRKENEWKRTTYTPEP